MAQILFGVLIVAGFMIWFITGHQGSFMTPVHMQDAAAVVLAPAASSFDVTGTLIFYPNNIGPIPYLYYQDDGGKTVSKSLTFMLTPPRDLASWAGARVRVVGTRDNEHILVNTITYVSPP